MCLTPDVKRKNCKVLAARHCLDIYWLQVQLACCLNYKVFVYNYVENCVLKVTHQLYVFYKTSAERMLLKTNSSFYVTRGSVSDPTV